jgi:hypothetical protein
MEKNRPVFAKNFGFIRLAIWRNVNDGVTWHNVAITRRYKDGTNWKEAPTFNGLGDLAQVAAAVALAQDWIAKREEETPAEYDTEE